MEVLVIYFSVNLFFCVYADIKMWVGPSTNFDNGRNWKALKKPAPYDSIVFDGTYDLPIEFPAKSILACELILPLSGEIILPAEMSLEIGGENAASRCKEEAIFTTKNRSYWLDPANWQGEEVNLATPDLERLPCAGDVVVFRPGHTYSLYIPNVLVNYIIIDGQIFYQDTLNDFLRSTTGSKMFAVDPALELPDPDVLPVIMLTDGCTAVSGCVCLYRSQGEVEDANACHVIRERCNPQPPCLTPILPYGSCCPICGAQLLFKPKHESTLKINNLKERVYEIVADFGIKQKPVDVHISRSFHDTVQIILVELGQYEGYVEELATQILDNITTDFKHDLALYHQILHSGYPYDPNGGFNVFGTIMFTGALSLGVLMAVYVHYYHDGWAFLGLARLGRTAQDSAFVFRRFDNERKEEPVVYEVTPRKSAKCFDNPMYNVQAPTKEAVASAASQSYKELRDKLEDEDEKD